MTRQKEQKDLAEKKMGGGGGGGGGGGERRIEEIGKGNQVIALRLQTRG